MTVMTLPRTRCAWSDLHTDECGHCRGDDGTPGLYIAAAPPAPRERWHPPTLTVRPAGPAEPSTITARYPLLCALGDDCRPEDRGGPRRVGGRSHLCPACEDATRERLVEVADAWPDLQARLTAIRALAASGFITGTAGVGIVLDEAASDAMRDAGLKAHFYARIVMRERGHTPDDATPSGLLRWLARSHVPWLAAHPDGGVAEGFAADAADLARQARTAAYPAGWRTIPVPLDCTAHVPTDPDDDDSPTQPCPGRMTARIRPDLHRLPDLVCDTNPDHKLGPDVWQRQGWKHAARNERATRRLLDRIVNNRHAPSTTGNS